MNKLTIVPSGGLCNRLRVILSAAEYCRINSRKLEIIWLKNKECFIHFYELFEINEITDIHLFDILNTPFHLRRPTRRNLYLSALFFLIVNLNKKYSSYIVDYNITRWTGGFFSRLFKRIDKKFNSAKYFESKGKNPIVFTCYPLLRNYSVNNLFTPKKSLLSSVDKITEAYSDNTFGLHIRMTDNTIAIQNSPLYLFDNLISNELAINPISKFFLSTDEQSVKEDFIAKYGNAIITNKGPLNRSSEQGMYLAMIDILCLSRTLKIYGSFYSSFSEYAANMGNIPLVIVKK